MKLKEALKIVVDHLDEKMQATPSRELADTSNYLQAELDSLDGDS